MTRKLLISAALLAAALTAASPIAATAPAALVCPASASSAHVVQHHCPGPVVAGRLGGAHPGSQIATSSPLPM